MESIIVLYLSFGLLVLTLAAIRGTLSMFEKIWVIVFAFPYIAMLFIAGLPFYMTDAACKIKQNENAKKEKM